MKKLILKWIKIITLSLAIAIIVSTGAFLAYISTPNNDVKPSEATNAVTLHDIKDKLRATKQGLPWNTQMVMPNKHGNIYVYIANGNENFQGKARMAIYVWESKTGIPIEPTMNKSLAQIRIHLVHSLNPKDKGKIITMGETQLNQNQLTYMSDINISLTANALWGAPDYTDVIEHELGHALGLDHNKRHHDIMNARIGEGYHLSNYDAEQAKRNYEIVMKSRK